MKPYRVYRRRRTQQQKIWLSGQACSMAVHTSKSQSGVVTEATLKTELGTHTRQQ